MTVPEFAEFLFWAFWPVWLIGLAIIVWSVVHKKTVKYKARRK